MQCKVSGNSLKRFVPAEDSPLTFPKAEVSPDLFRSLRQGSQEVPAASLCHDQEALR